ncbi:hypothetical protein MWU65_04435 [Cellulophaga sp. F20128]|uniref:hypothetical protein n=1 Tax=Cellulophaga sp. F20128 TaxID=2926413 RepID=UPI001FF3D4CD|nr:hypothetical protein [Cellulophaga sp. F20128]MCK0156412.1 hypothetical protein [Cellulophaga sp. F20128]
MKNLTFSLLSTFVFSLLLSCEEREHPPKDTPVDPPKQIITTKQAQLMFDNYTDRRVPIIQKYEDSVVPKEQFDVARYGSYDYKTLKKYIEFIEQEAKKAQVDISTLRFYFANYSNDPKAKHPRQNSFFIVPTTNAEGKDYGFSVLSDGNGNYKAELLKNNFLLQPNTKLGATKAGRTKTYATYMPMLPFFAEDTTSLILNESNIVPPPY